MTVATSTRAAIVDSHAHLVPAQLVEDLASGHVKFSGVAVARRGDTFTVSFNGGPPTRPIDVGLMDQTRRAEWLDENGVDVQVVGGWLDIFGYGLDPREGAEWAEVLTDSLTQVVSPDPRYSLLGAVPLQSPHLAAVAVRRQRAAGLPGVMIATRAGTAELSDETYSPFWQAAHETEAVVFLHPGFGGTSDRYHDFGLVNGLARLEDTTVTLARLLYAGVPATYPGAKIVVAHAGAALPYVLGRLMRNHSLNPGTKDPLESFQQLYFDSLVFEPEALEFLVNRVGAQRVLLGSDYPFPIGDLRPRLVVSGSTLTPQEQLLINGANARRLLLEGTS